MNETTTITVFINQLFDYLKHHLNQRSVDILRLRFGLGSELEQKTLEQIGELYGGLSRERVRQIENAAINILKESPILKREVSIINALYNEINLAGGIISKNDLLTKLFPGHSEQNYAYFYLQLQSRLDHNREDEIMFDCWTTDSQKVLHIKQALKEFHFLLEDSDFLSENRAVAIFSSFLGISATPSIISTWMSLSKIIQKNSLGYWGRSDASVIRLTTISDYAFILLKNRQSGMHFTTMAAEITSEFKITANVDTLHNSLLKDKRFVRVSRGTYILKK